MIIHEVGGTLILTGDALELLKAMPDRGDAGIECACCMGELIDSDDAQKIKQARAALAPFGENDEQKDTGRA